MTGMVWKPDVTVAAIAERDGRFLLVEERASGRVVLNQPAGHLEDGETFLDAVVRETLEETAWDFRPRAIVGVYVWRPAHLGRTFLRVAFCGELAGARPRAHRSTAASSRTRWLTRDELARAASPAAQPAGAAVRGRLPRGRAPSARAHQSPDRPARLARRQRLRQGTFSFSLGTGDCLRAEKGECPRLRR